MYVKCTISESIFLQGRVSEKHEMKVIFVLNIKVLVKVLFSAVWFCGKRCTPKTDAGSASSIQWPVTTPYDQMSTYQQLN